MAPTAAMLILSRAHSHGTKHTPPSPPQSAAPPAPATFMGVKVSAVKWVPFYKERSGDKHYDMLQSSLSADSTMEKRFQEALELSCW